MGGPIQYAAVLPMPHSGTQRSKYSYQIIGRGRGDRPLSSFPSASPRMTRRRAVLGEGSSVRGRPPLRRRWTGVQRAGLGARGKGKILRLRCAPLRMTERGSLTRIRPGTLPSAALRESGVRHTQDPRRGRQERTGRPRAKIGTCFCGVSMVQ